MSTQNRSGSPIISHGRGGAGNIAPDEKAYTDGEIVREGSIGDQGDGAYSSGVSPSSLPPITKPPPKNTSPCYGLANAAPPPRSVAVQAISRVRA